MNKLGLVIVLSGSFSLLMACNSTKEEVKPQVVIECTFPGTRTPAPGWICDEPVEKLSIFATGTWEKSVAGYGFMKEMAIAQARGELADILGVEVTKRIAKNISSIGAGANERVSKSGESHVILFTKQHVVGSRLYKSITAPNGDIFVLVGMDKELVRKTVTEVLQADMENNSEKWQKFGVSQRQEEIIAEVVNSF